MFLLNSLILTRKRLYKNKKSTKRIKSSKSKKGGCGRRRK